LKELREEAGLSRTTIAYAARRSEQSVSLWERGMVTPPFEVLARVASIIGCQVDDFLDGDSDGTR
jgi:predicted transcriptional regulator